MLCFEAFSPVGISCGSFLVSHGIDFQWVAWGVKNNFSFLWIFCGCFGMFSPLPRATQPTNHNNTMTTQQIIDKALSHKNWTGHSLADLIDAGRCAPKIENVMSYIRAACGEAENMETLKTYWQAAQQICGETAA